MARGRRQARTGSHSAEEFRARICRAAVNQFLRQGFAKAGVREIAAEAKVSVGTVFNYFDSKHDILFRIIADLQESVAIPMQLTAAECRARASDGADPEEALLSMIGDFAVTIDEWSRELLLTYQEARSLRRPNLRQILDGERRMRDLIADLIQIGAERGKFTHGDVKFRAHAIQMLVHSWATRRWALEDVGDLEDFVAACERAVLALLHAPEQDGPSEATRRGVGGAAAGSAAARARRSRSRPPPRGSS